MRLDARQRQRGVPPRLINARDSSARLLRRRAGGAGRRGAHCTQRRQASPRAHTRYRRRHQGIVVCLVISPWLAPKVEQMVSSHASLPRTHARTALATHTTHHTRARARAKRRQAAAHALKQRHGGHARWLRRHDVRWLPACRPGAAHLSSTPPRRLGPRPAAPQGSEHSRVSLPAARPFRTVAHGHSARVLRRYRCMLSTSVSGVHGARTRRALLLPASGVAARCII